MAIDLTNLQSYVQDPNVLLGRLLNKETILKSFEPHDGYHPGQSVLRLYNAGGDLDDTCKVPEGTGSFDEQIFDIVAIQSGNEFCLEDLSRYIRDAGMRYTAGKTSAGSVEEVIMYQEIAKIGRNIDNLVFQGDKTSANGNLNKLDGLLKLADEELAGDRQITISSGNVYDAIQALVAEVPYEAFDWGDIVVMAGRDVVKALQAALVAMNLTHYNPGDKQVDEDIWMPGMGRVWVKPARGLDGTGRMIATPLENCHWLTNLEDDYQEALWDYDNYNQKFYWRVKFLLGVGFARYDILATANITDDVLKAKVGMPVQEVATPQP